MIVYFSATGNCKRVAERISEHLGDVAVSMEKASDEVALAEGQCLGIVSPTHWWQLPVPVREYIRRLRLSPSRDSYVFAVFTFGTTPGCCGEETHRMLRRKGIGLDAAFGVRMPDNWTPIFDLSDPGEVRRKVESAEREIDALLPRIASRERGNHTRPRTPYFLHPVTTRLLDRERRTAYFTLDSACIGCGLCAKRCPARVIEMREGKPVWTKEQCWLCLRCLHSCPKFAIQYGKNTRRHGQYRNPMTGRP